jgi:hypothetical protein
MSNRALISIAIVLSAATVGSAQDPPQPLNILVAVQTNYAATTQRAESSLGFVEDGMNLTEATLSVTGGWEQFGFRVDGGAGDFYKIAMAGDTWKGPNQYLSQTYFTVKPFADLPLTVDAGKFFTSAGAEVPQSYLDQDFNITRSLLFWYGTPLYHVGVRASIPLSSTVTVGAQLLSGTNTITGDHGHQSMAFTAVWTHKHWSVSQFYMGGNQKSAGSGWRQLSDTIVTLTPGARVRAYVEMLGGIEKRITPGCDRWFGWATGWTFTPIDKWSISPRVEWYSDPTGATTGVAQHMAEFTLTGEYRPSKLVITRLEYRNDWSDRPLFNRRASLIAGITLLYQRGL